MSGIEINTSVTDAGLIAALQAIEMTAEARGSILNLIGSTMVESTHGYFETQIGVDGNPWTPSNRTRVDGGETLRDTGVHLYNTINHQLRGDDSVEWGTNFEWAHVLHFGATIRPVRGEWLVFKSPDGSFAKKKEVIIPPRPFLGFTEQDQQDVTDIINIFISQQVH